MQNYKPLVYLIVFFFVTAWVIKVQKHFEENKEIHSEWSTYEKDENGIVSSRRPTPEELAKIDPEALEQTDTKEEQRAPASIAKKEKAPSRYPTFLGRRLLGATFEDIPNLRYLQLENRYNEKWQQEMANDLLRTQPDHLKLTVKHEQSIIKINQDRGRLYEKVTLTYDYQNPFRGLQSYTALVDSETGKIVSTWNQTIQDPLPGRRMPVRLRPTGHLNSENQDL